MLGVVIIYTGSGFDIRRMIRETRNKRRNK
jgi:hypothetical protein